MDDDIRLLIKVSFWILLTITIAIGLMVGLGMVVEKNYCTTMERLSPQYTFQWELWGGCLVEIDGLYIHAPDYLNKTRQEIELQKGK